MTGGKSGLVWAGLLTLWTLAMSLTLGGSPAGGAARAGVEVRGVEASEAEISAALAERGADGCRAEVVAALRRGERRREGAGPCDAALERALRRLIEVSEVPPRFGVVEERRADLAGVSVKAWVVRGCRRWLLRRPEIGSPLLSDAQAAGCRAERRAEPLPLELIDRGGERVALARVRSNSSGRYEVRLGDVETELASRGLPPLVAWQTLELGAAGWAWRVDLVALHRELAEKHALWVRRGRGAPALAASLHPDHPAADSLHALAEEARVARQAADYQAVVEGVMPAWRFLERYPRSPFRRAVTSQVLTPTTPVTIEADESLR